MLIYIYSKDLYIQSNNTFFFLNEQKKKKTNQPVETMESKKVDYTELEFEHGDELLLA